MGTVVLSVDAELGWGFHDQETLPRERLSNAREGWQTLLECCDEFGIDATWAIVGHLLLDDCQGQHDDHPIPSTWFAHERGDEPMPAAYRYGPDLVEAVRTARADHDLGIHTFSHVELGAETTTRERARAEVAANVTLAHEQGIQPTSFVFPRNNVGHRDVLAAYGIECYRGVNPERGWLTSWDSALGKLTRTTLSRRAPPVVEPTVDSYGLVNVPASLHLFSFEGRSRRLVEPLLGDPVVRQARRGIDAAVEREGVFHMWLHPNSITDECDTERVRTILSYLDQRRADTDLTVETMADVAARTREEVNRVEADPVERL